MLPLQHELTPDILTAGISARGGGEGTPVGPCHCLGAWQQSCLFGHPLQERAAVPGQNRVVDSKLWKL